ncbi:hypothetical protein ES288_A12G240200v1 [Gossypium darwinii]|uniref:Uncharacterized protein n=1 Tax=Gossypium darwinii TaxID=34276 RepID=A0A5D2EC77_GOSDA|nr:hypothetical protein ES288_A12G240200v1 [Gossypium darwinii]
MQDSTTVGDKTIEILLLSAFKIRYKEILTKAYTAAYTTASKFLTLLTKEESNSQVSMSAFKKWRMGGPKLQRASVLIQLIEHGWGIFIITRGLSNASFTDSAFNLDEQISQLMQCKPLSEQQVRALCDKA